MSNDKTVTQTCDANIIVSGDACFDHRLWRFKGKAIDHPARMRSTVGYQQIRADGRSCVIIAPSP